VPSGYLTDSQPPSDGQYDKVAVLCRDSPAGALTSTLVSVGRAATATTRVAMVAAVNFMLEFGG